MVGRDNMLGESAAFLDLLDQVSRAAVQARPLLIIGERGTGKELIAARLHFLSNRWDRDFLKMNCAAMPETLLESELFGYEAGAFTGAAKRRKGRFERADDGTLFLDEIATMSAAAQEKLLRVVEYGEFERVGGSETLTVDVRVIGATNVDLPALADAGLFRHDLLDRLAFDVITVPPLRERGDDILLLAEAFGSAMAREQEWPHFPGFSEEARDTLLTHNWPGNVRELKNVVERAVYRAWDAEAPIDTIVLDPFESPWRPKMATTGAPQPQKPLTEQHPGSDACLKSAIAELERQMLHKAMDAAKHNQRVAAQALNLSYDQLRHALKKHNML